VNRELPEGNLAQIEAQDFQGGPPRLVFKLRGVSQLPSLFQDFTWLPDGRVVYVGGEPDIHGYSCNLWQARVNNKTAALVREPERLTDWAGFCLAGLSHTADGKKLAFTRSTDLLTVYVAQWDANKSRISTPDRLTLTDDMSSAAGWTPDSTAVLIRSNREGSWGLYKQVLTGEVADPIVTGLKNISWVTSFSPDRRWFVYDSRDPSEDARILHTMRVAVSGGPAEEITKGYSLGARCPAFGNNSCAIAELNSDKTAIIFIAMNPVQGRRDEIGRFPSEHADQFAWDLSPDGGRVAVFREFDQQFHLVTLRKKAPVQDIPVKGGAQLRTLSWAADGKGLFGSRAIQQGAELLYIDLAGNSHILWRLRGRDTFLWGRPSPDGRRLAIVGSAGTANVWVMEDF